MTFVVLMRRSIVQIEAFVEDQMYMETYATVNFCEETYTVTHVFNYK